MKTAAEVIKLADEYVLTHRGDHKHQAWDDVGYRGDGRCNR